VQRLFRHFIGHTNHHLLSFQSLNPSSTYPFIILYVRLFTQRVLQIKYHFHPHKFAGHAAAKGEMRNGYKNVVRKQERTIRNGRDKRSVRLLTEIIWGPIKTSV